MRACVISDLKYAIFVEGNDVVAQQVIYLPR